MHTGYLVRTWHFQRMWDLIVGRKGAQIKPDFRPVLALHSAHKHSVTPDSKEQQGEWGLLLFLQARRWLPVAHISSKSSVTSGGLWKSHIPWTI